LFGIGITTTIGSFNLDLFAGYCLVLALLVNRTSCSKLTAPAPEGDALQQIIKAGLRAPDHARLQPWRFITIQTDGLQRLGDLFLQAALLKNPQMDEAAQLKCRQKPLRAPLIIAVVAAPKAHPKVPEQEQLYSAACAAHALLLAANSLGFAGIWRTGGNAYDAHIKQGLGLQAHEQLIGYVYLGTAAGATNPLPVTDINRFISQF
jgi:nitroreductase